MDLFISASVGCEKLTCVGLCAEGAGVKLPRLSVGGSSEVPLNVEETDLSLLDASILTPSGKEEPCELKRLDNGQTGNSSR